MSENRRSPLASTAIAALTAGVIAVSAGLFAVPAQAEPQNTNTPANVIHPGLLANGATNNNASPDNEGGGNTDDAGLHGIGNVPGQGGGDQPGDGAPGFADSLNTVHGGIGTKNKNVLP